MYQWLSNFLETLAERAPTVPRPFNSFWEAMGRPEPGKRDPEPPEPSATD